MSYRQKLIKQRSTVGQITPVEGWRYNDCCSFSVSRWAAATPNTSPHGPGTYRVLHFKTDQVPTEVHFCKKRRPNTESGWLRWLGLRPHHSKIRPLRWLGCVLERNLIERSVINKNNDSHSERAPYLFSIWESSTSRHQASLRKVVDSTSYSSYCSRKLYTRECQLKTI